MKILICGDVHGNWPAFCRHIVRAKQIGLEFDAVLQVGDFGVYKGYLKPLYEIFKDFPLPIYFIDGNHEDHQYLLNCATKMKKHNFHYLKRGTILEIDGALLGFMGGALNAHCPQAYNEKTNWFDNVASPSQLKQFIKDVGDRQLDVMFTHSCPSRMGVNMMGSIAMARWVEEFFGTAGFDVPPINDCGDNYLTFLYNGLQKKPEHWLFGHFHNLHHQKVGTTDFQCVGCADNRMEGSVNAFFIYDTKTKQLLK